jgi:hypothetical protein
MKKHARELQPQLLPESTLGQAVKYFLNEYDAPLVYLQDALRSITTWWRMIFVLLR